MESFSTVLAKYTLFSRLPAWFPQWAGGGSSYLSCSSVLRVSTCSLSFLFPSLLDCQRMHRPSSLPFYFSLRSYALRRLPLNLLPSAVKGVCFKTSLLHPLRPDSRGCSSEVSANAPRAPATASRPQDGAGRGGSVRNDFR